MGAAVMMKRIAEVSPRFKARIAGVLSLLSLLAAVFGEFIVQGSHRGFGQYRCDAAPLWHL